MEDAKTIWGQAFEFFVFGSALTSPFLDCIGPRYFATLGLMIEAIGHHLLAQIASYHLEQGVMILSVACGMIGIGGNMLMLASIQFSNLFKNPCTVAAMMSGAYQFAGFIFTLLKFIHFDAFFQAYELITAVGMCLTFVCYPNEPYTSVKTPTCSWPKMLCIKRQPRALAACKNCLVPLQLTRTWLFLSAFSLGATCGAWCSGTFLQEVTLKATIGDQQAVQTFIIWMPLVSNATFLFSPCIGMLIDSYGFIPAVQILWSTVVSSVLSLWLLPMSYQWWTLLSLNWLQTVTYSLQFTYIAQRYPSDQFGVVMAFSTVAQSAVNLLGLYLLTRPPKLAALVFILPTCIICQVSGPQVGGCQVAGWFFLTLQQHFLWKKLESVSRFFCLVVCAFCSVFDRRGKEKTCLILVDPRSTSTFHQPWHAMHFEDPSMISHHSGVVLERSATWDRCNMMKNVQPSVWVEPWSSSVSGGMQPHPGMNAWPKDNAVLCCFYNWN